LDRVNTYSAQQIWYPYEEFSDHLKAMKTVREWEDTSRFGHVGKAQTSRANNARIVEYFSDCYADQCEAVRKAELFLCIHDYIARNAAIFSRKEMVEETGSGQYAVDPALLRAVHHAFTAPGQPENLAPKKVLTLARAFEQIQPA